MARVQLIIPDQDRERFVRQAKREGMTFSAWLRAAAQARVEEQRRQFSSPDELEEFFRWCDALDGPETEPEWSEHLEIIGRSRSAGGADS
ncbi:MAG: hypothetical protein OXE50_03195 [Chloroflexi bacterium]|nr:hypothetical protein [Chloroflexota bacterium]